MATVSRADSNDVNQKAEAAAQKKAVEDSKKAAEEDAKWSKGSKSNAKKYVTSFSS